MNSSSVPASARPAALGEPRELAAQDLARRGRDVGAVVPDDVGEAQRRPLLPRHAAQRRRGRAASRSRRTRAPTRPSRSPRPASCRRRRRAGSCSPRRRARRPRRGRCAAMQALALQAPLHVGDREQDGVDRPAARPRPSAPPASSAVEGTAPEPFRARERYRARADGVQPPGGAQWRDRASFRRERGS